MTSSRLPLALYAAVFAAGWLAVVPWPAGPVIDDWVYAWSVEHLLATGSLSVLPFSAVYPVAQTLWASPFAALFGFSFLSLRVSTLVLAVLGCWALHGTLRELGASPRASLVGGLALALHPIYFPFAYTFMTEVAFVSASTLALYCYVRAVMRADARWLWAGGALAIAAFGVRPVGILLPLIVVPALLWRTNGRPFARAQVGALLVALALMALLQVALPAWLGPLDWAGIRAQQLTWLFTVPVASYVAWTIEAVVRSSFPFAPLLIAGAFARGRASALAATGIAVLLAVTCWFATGELPTPLAIDDTWSIREFSARSMIDGDLPIPAAMDVVAPITRTLGLLGVGALLVMAWTAWQTRAQISAGVMVLVSYFVLHLAAIDVLWFYNDRYYIVLAPVLAAAAAWLADHTRGSRAVAVAGLAFLAVVDVTGTRDMLAFNRVLQDEVRALDAQGIPAWDIDGGYTLNGWRLYAHPEQLPPGADRRTDVPFVTSKDSTRYSIVNVPLPGDEVLRTVPLPNATWQVTHQVQVVRRTPTPRPWTRDSRTPP